MIKNFFVLCFLFTLFATAQADELRLKNLQGEEQSLGQYTGKIVVLNFWATWCLPCREEMPLFVQLQTEYAQRGVQFIAASIDAPEDRQKVDAFVKEFRLTFPVWIDATIEQQASFELGTAVPATGIYDRAGKLRFRIIGQSNRKDLQKRIDYLISGQIPEPDALVLPPGISKEHFEQHHARGDTDEHHEHHDSAGSEVPS
jgi:thiol-disulfide isomerase/thioredoxin